MDPRPFHTKTLLKTHKILIINGLFSLVSLYDDLHYS